MKKEYTDPKGSFFATSISSKKDLEKIEKLAIEYFPELEKTLTALESGEADDFFEDGKTPFATWLIPQDNSKDGKDEFKKYWQIERTAKGRFSSFSIETITREGVLATVAKKYIVPTKMPFEIIEVQETIEGPQYELTPEKDGHIRYEEEGK